MDNDENSNDWTVMKKDLYVTPELINNKSHIIFISSD